MINDQIVAVIDFGSQYTQLITRRIRELNVYAEIFSFDVDFETLKEKNTYAIILSGGPSSVYHKNSPKISDTILNSGIPILGICYGLQLLIQSFGGSISYSNKGEYGSAKVVSKNNSLLFDGIPKESQVWMSHGDRVESLPNGWEIISKSVNDIIAAVEKRQKKIFGVQFHPEVVHSLNGSKIISNFLFKISNCKANWTPKNFVKSAILDIQNNVGDSKVICGLSGGVDSSVVATLLCTTSTDKTLFPFPNFAKCAIIFM